IDGVRNTLRLKEQGQKFFICQQEPSDSFAIELSQEELPSLTIKELLEKANSVYNFNHKFYRMARIQNQIGNLLKQDKNDFLANSHFNLFPFYFFPKKYIFEIDVKFNDETYHFELPVTTTQKVNLFVPSDKIFYDDKEVFVDLNLKVSDNIQLFNFANWMDIYMGNQLISKNKTFAQSGVQNGDKLYSYYLINAQIKDIETQIKHNFTKQEAKDLYQKYYPEEKGRVITEKTEDTLYIRLSNDQEMNLTIKTLSGIQYDLGADGNEIIGQLKQKVSSLSDVESEFITLIYCGRQLENNFTLNEYKIKDESTIHMILKAGAKIKSNPIYSDSEIQIQIKTLTGSTIALKCKLNQTVDWLKKQISHSFETSPSQQKLIYSGQQLEDEKQLYFYNLQRDCVVHIVQTIQKVKEIQKPEQKQQHKHKQENRFIKVLEGKLS
ncbi:hypothetical protein ABPG72_008584, partial [Tetrahymena utriculariae]